MNAAPLLLRGLICLLPWPLKRWFLGRFFGYRLSPSAKIGLAWVFPAHLDMEENSSIDHFCVVIHLDQVWLMRDSHIGRGNWITGLSTRASTPHFHHIPGRSALLQLGEGARITKGHHFDCSDAITIGRFATIAGYGSQFLTHSIDLQENRQSCAPIRIGDYCFVGTRVVVLGGSNLPSHSVLGACALLNRSWSEPWSLFGGVPARRRAAIPHEARYFSRSDGFVI